MESFAACSVTLSPCGRGWRAPFGASRVRGLLAIPTDPSPASQPSAAQHPLPQGERVTEHAASNSDSSNNALCELDIMAWAAPIRRALRHTRHILLQHQAATDQILRCLSDRIGVVGR